MRPFVVVAIKIQGEEWIPGPLGRYVLYGQQIEATKDGVEIWRLDEPQNQLSPLRVFKGQVAKKLTRKLSAASMHKLTSVIVHIRMNHLRHEPVGILLDLFAIILTPDSFIFSRAFNRIDHDHAKHSFRRGQPSIHCKTH